MRAQEFSRNRIQQMIYYNVIWTIKKRVGKIWNRIMINSTMTQFDHEICILRTRKSRRKMKRLLRWSSKRQTGFCFSGGGPRGFQQSSSWHAAIEQLMKQNDVNNAPSSEIPGAVSRVDKMFVVKVYCKIETSPWALTLTEPVPEAFELPASDWPEIFFLLANQRREAAGCLSCFLTQRSFPHRSPCLRSAFNGKVSRGKFQNKM